MKLPLRQHAHLYDPIIENIEDWPISKLNENREDFVNELTDWTFKEMLNRSIEKGTSINKIIENAVYYEQMRIKKDPWKVDPKDEKKWWQKIKKGLVQASIERPESKNLPAGELEKKLLKKIIHRYSDEIVGEFHSWYYRFVSNAFPVLFTFMLNASTGKARERFFGKKRMMKLWEKLQITGPFEKIQQLCKDHTIVLLPTHFSNLDSLVVGWAIQTIGLPAFNYGAGLNLLNTKFFSHFIGRLGAYKVDRRKKNIIYLKVLKDYSTLALTKGVHSLFFPGGTRSRSGAIEDKLKLGLLGTLFEAQRINLENGNLKKIIVLPMTINYQFVLEAQSLIHQHLKDTGREKYYIEQDYMSSTWKIINFIFKFFRVQSNMSISYGDPLDVFGNPVNEKGESLDNDGKIIDISEKFKIDGAYQANHARDSKYTQDLSDVVVSEFLRVNKVMPGHILAFTAFEYLIKTTKLDLYELLRFPEKELEINFTEFLGDFQIVKEHLLKLHKEGKVQLCEEFFGDTHELINQGLRNCGLYNTKRPIRRNKKGNFVTQNLNTLYYYHNRLQGYDLHKLF